MRKTENPTRVGRDIWIDPRPIIRADAGYEQESADLSSNKTDYKLIGPLFIRLFSGCRLSRTMAFGCVKNKPWHFASKQFRAKICGEPCLLNIDRARAQT
jgi:hypothetical protein